MSAALQPDVALAVALTAFVWSITRSHSELKATCVMALMITWYAWVPVALHPELPSAAEALWVTRLAVVAMTCAIVASACIQGFPARLRLDRSDIAIEGSYRIALVIATLAGVLTCCAYFLQVRSVPILAPTGERAAAREAATTTLPFFGTASLAIYTVLPLAWSGWMSIGRLAIGLSVFALNVLAVTATGQKAPLAYQAFVMFLVTARGRRRFPYGGLALLATVLAGVLLVLVFVHNFGFTSPDPGSITASIEGLVRRAVAVPAEVIAGWVTCFPEQHRFVGIGATEVPMDQIVYQHMNPSSPYQGTANGAFFLSLYGRFGDSPTLFFMSTALVSFGMAMLDLRVLARPRPTATMAAYPLLCLGAAQLAVTDAYTAMAPVGLGVLSMWGCTFVVDLARGRRSVHGTGSRANRSQVFALMSILALAYLLQGRIRALFASIP